MLRCSFKIKILPMCNVKIEHKKTVLHEKRSLFFVLHKNEFLFFLVDDYIFVPTRQ